MPHNPETVPVAEGRTDLPVKPNGKRWNAATTYEPEFCQTLLDMMKEGASYYEVCRELDIAHSTMLDWCKGFPEFDEAYKRGLDLARGWIDERVKETIVIENGKDVTTKKIDGKSVAQIYWSRFGLSEKNPIFVLGESKDPAAIEAQKSFNELVDSLRKERS